MSDTRVGTELAGYRVIELIGRGGMGAVYLAEHLGLKRRVALKLLASELSDSERFRSRFIRESQLAASLDHPNVVPIYEAGEAEGHLYIAMRYVEGTDLKRLIRASGGFEPMRAVPIIRQVAGALDAAHARGLVHRDVKPANILIAQPESPEEHAYLSDFGLTKHALSKSGLTGTGEFMGTVDYAAPEQFEGKPLNARTDQYSLGCVLYESLTGAVPFPREQEAAVMYAHLQEPPPRVTAMMPALPPGIDDVVATAMAKAPDRRFANCSELARAAESELGIVPDIGTGVRVWRKRRARRAIVGLVALVAAAAVIGAVLFLSYREADDGAAAEAVASGLSRIDPGGGAVSEEIRFGEAPIAVGSGAGALWVADFGEQAVWRVDPAGGAPESIPLGGAPTGVAFGEGTVWVTEEYDGHLLGIDPASLRVVVDVPIPTGSEGVAVGEGAVWVSNYNTNEVLRYDIASDALTKISVGQGPRGIAVGEGAVWVANTLDGTLSRIDPGTAEVVGEPIVLRFAPYGVAAGSGFVWVTHLLDNQVSRIDPETNRPSSFVVPGGPLGIAANDEVWVASVYDGTASLVDPLSLTVLDTVSVGVGAEALTIDGSGAVWVTERPL